MGGGSCGLTSLSDFVSEILFWTENVKIILESECNEARYVLRPWPIETMICKEIDESCCTCDSKASLGNHVQEIVEGIGRALKQAQELREKIAINVSKQKRKMREPDVKTIYAPANKKIVTNRNNEVSKVRKFSNEAIKQGCSVVASTSGSGIDKSKGKSACVQRKDKISPGKKTNCPSKNITDRKLLRVSAGNTIVSKEKSTKNFVAANKSNIKILEKTNSKSTVDPKSELSGANFIGQRRGASSSQSSNSCSASIAELNRLMDKVSTEEAKPSSSSSTQEIKDDNCPCHGTKSENIVEQRVRTTVDTMEGLDRFGVPGDIVRILKMYHSYSSNELSGSARATADDKRCERAANRFLNEFQTMNEERNVRQKNCGNAEVSNLIVDFSRLLRDAHSQPFVDSALIGTTNRYVELDGRSKTCPVKKFDPLKFRKMEKLRKHSSIARGWCSNGVWNRLGVDVYPDLTRTVCIRYANRSQLASFFELNQRLQQLHYHGCLIELLSEKVIPEICNEFHPDTPEYSEAYKMFFAIAQVLNPRIPVLVRTDI